MAENTYKKKSTNPRPSPASDWWSKVWQVNWEEIQDEGLPTRYLPRMLFLSALGIVYIANAHFAERTVRQTTEAEAIVDSLRAKHAIVKAEYDKFAGRKSEIAKRADSLGLVEGQGKVQKIVIPKGKY